MSLLGIAGYPLLLLSLAILPGIIYVTLYYKWDTHKKEPFEIVLKSFLWGAATVIPIGLFQSILPGENLQSLAPAYAIYMIVVVGFSEELCKWLVVRFYSTRQIAFDEVTDGVVYGACAGGGFAVFENIFYVMENGWEVAIIRATLSVPGHIIWGSISGYWIGMYKFAHVPKSTMLIKGLIFSAFAHGLFNTSLSYGMSIFFAPIFIIIPGIIARRNLKNALAYDMQYIHSFQKISESRDTIEEKDGEVIYSHEESTVLNPNPILKKLVSLLFRFIGVIFLLTAAFLTLGFWELIHKEAEKGYSYNDMWIPGITAIIGILFYIKGFKVKKSILSPQ